ncbi:hypothetical protein B0H14DRAFT_3441463 [Mycena olivaceomarginata]|nr:hypothetical protein B0H14DRAFT_3441463 [Mycena olivaceomarginata]
MDPPGIDSFIPARVQGDIRASLEGSIEGILNVLKLPVRSEGSEPESHLARLAEPLVGARHSSRGQGQCQGSRHYTRLHQSTRPSAWRTSAEVVMIVVEAVPAIPLTIPTTTSAFAPPTTIPSAASSCPKNVDLLITV